MSALLPDLPALSVLTSASWDAVVDAINLLDQSNVQFNSIAALRANTSPCVMATTLGYYVPGDQGGGTFLYSAVSTATDNGGTVIVDTNGRRFLRMLSGDEAIDVRWFGAKVNGVWDDTSAINAALALGRPTRLGDGSSYVSGTLLCAFAGQRIFGSDTWVSKIAVAPGFVVATGTTGVFYINIPGNISSGYGIRGPVFDDFGIYFPMPETTVFASLIQFVAGFVVNAVGRVRMRNVRIQTGYTGIQFIGDCGGFIAEGCEFSCLQYNVLMDGCLDTMRYDNCDFWPFGMTDGSRPNLANLFWSNTCAAFSSGRVDNIQCNGCLFYIGDNSAAHFYRSASGITFGSLVGCDFDTNGCIVMDDGRLFVDGGSITQGDGTSLGAQVNGGDISFNNVYWYTGTLTSSQNSVVVNGGSCKIIGGTMETSVDQSQVGITAGQLIVDGVQFKVGNPSAALATPRILLVGGSGVISNCVNQQVTGGSGAFINFSTDVQFTVNDNNGGGRNITASVALTTALFASTNVNFSAETVGNCYYGPVFANQYFGTTDGSGNITVAHGISQLQQKVKSAIATYKIAGGARIMGFPSSIDGGNISFQFGSGGASTPCTIFIQYGSILDTR